MLARRLSVAVTNFSDDAPAAGAVVRVASSRWGIGMPRAAVGMFSADLGVASAPNARASHTIELDPDGGERVFYVRVEHPKDRDQANNEGVDAQQRLNLTSGPFTFGFTVRNALQRAITVDLQSMNGTWGAVVTPSVLTLAPGQNAVATLSGDADVSGMTPSDRENFTIVATVDGALYGGLTYRLGPAPGG